eukprot:4170261-Pyramimonas_sp.AAC.1
MEIADRPHITTARIDHCATGLKDTAGDYIQKPTNITSNDEAILKPLERLKCNGQHVHAQPCNKELSLARANTLDDC